METAELKKVLAFVPQLLKVPYTRVWTTYDKEADVLYVICSPNSCIWYFQ